MNLRNGLATVTVYFTLTLCNNFIIRLCLADASTFEYCMKQRQISGIGTCLGQQALEYLQRIEDSNNVTVVQGLEIVKVKDTDSTSKARSFVNFLDLNPADFRGILDGMATVVQSRSMKWDLDMLYPGLQMRVGPYQGVNSMLEFVLDDHLEFDQRKAFYSNNIEKTSVGRALTKSFILPFLLGFKFNLSLLLPVLIGLLIIVGKKIVFISKLVLLISGIMGYGGPFLGSFGYGHHQNQHYGHKPLYHDGYYKEAFHDKESGRGSASGTIEVTEAPYEFDRFYDYEKSQPNRYDRVFSTYDDDDLRPRSQRSGNIPIATDFQTSNSNNKRQQPFTWRTTSN